MSTRAKRRRFSATSATKRRTRSLTPGLLQHGGHGLALVGAGEDGAAHEAAQIGALFDHGLDGLQIRRDGIELLGLVGQFEQCRSVACGEPGGAGMLGCQMEDPVSMKDPRRHGPDPEKPPARQALQEAPGPNGVAVSIIDPGVATAMLQRAPESATKRRV